MVLVIESSDPALIDVFSTLAKALKVDYRVETDNPSVSKEERLRRVKIAKKFKGGLKAGVSAYQPQKHDWYQQ